MRLALILVGAVLLAGALNALLPRDDTDAPDARSGMRLYIDHGTGCEYVSGLFKPLTPRMRADGTHVCRTQHERQQ